MLKVVLQRQQSLRPYQNGGLYYSSPDMQDIPVNCDFSLLCDVKPPRFILYVVEAQQPLGKPVGLHCNEGLLDALNAPTLS